MYLDPANPMLFILSARPWLTVPAGGQTSYLTKDRRIGGSETKTTLTTAICNSLYWVFPSVESGRSNL